MTKLTELPNIRITLAGKLQKIEISTEQELIDQGSEKVLLQLATLPNNSVCFALEGAIQDIRWHSLDKLRKQELKEFYNSMRN